MRLSSGLWRLTSHGKPPFYRYFSNRSTSGTMQRHSPPWLVVNSWLTVSAYLIILNVLNNSIVTLFHFLLFLRYALRNLPGMRQLRGYNQRKNEGKMKAGTSETSGEFSLLEWQRTDLVLKEQVLGQACTRNKKCYLYEVYMELRYTSFTETYQFGVTIFVTLPGLKLVILLM